MYRFNLRYRNRSWDRPLVSYKRTFITNFVNFIFKCQSNYIQNFFTMSQNYQSYKRYHEHYPIKYSGMRYENGQIEMNRVPFGPYYDDTTLKKRTLKKFETLEKKLRGYLAEFIKYADSSRAHNVAKSIVAEQNIPEETEKKMPSIKRTKIVNVLEVAEESPLEQNFDKFKSSNIEKKILDIERKTKAMQKYNRILEESYKKNKMDNEDNETIAIDPYVRQVIFEEVKKLEDNLSERRVQGMENIPEYTNCKTMLKECINMLGEAIKEERNEDWRLIEVPKIGTKKLVNTRVSQSRNHQDLSDDDFFKQYNLNINDDDDLDFNDDIRDSDLRDQKMQLKISEYMEDDEEEDEIDTINYPQKKRFESEEYQDDDTDEVSTRQPTLFVKSYKQDKKKLHQIHDELLNLEKNNQKFLNVIMDLKSSLHLRYMEDENINGYEFAEDMSKMKEVTRDFQESEKNVDKLIRKLKKHLRYNLN